jgi:hypothetical protein
LISRLSKGAEMGSLWCGSLCQCLEPTTNRLKLPAMQASHSPRPSHHTPPSGVEHAPRRASEGIGIDIDGPADPGAGLSIMGERVLALVGPDVAAESVVLQARRLADALGAPLSALHVELPNAPNSIDPVAALRRRL